MTTTKKRNNVQDATLKNVRVLKKRCALMLDLIETLDARLTILESNFQKLSKKKR